MDQAMQAATRASRVNDVGAKTNMVNADDALNNDVRVMPVGIQRKTEAMRFGTGSDQRREALSLPNAGSPSVHPHGFFKRPDRGAIAVHVADALEGQQGATRFARGHLSQALHGQQFDVVWVARGKAIDDQ